MLPNKPKITVSGEIGNGDFSHMAHRMPCLPVLLTTKSEHSFLQRNAQTRSNFCKNKICKQCMCGHKHKKSPETAFAAQVIFLLVEAPPQSLTNTKCVLKHSPSDCGYSIFQIAISHKYFSWNRTGEISLGLCQSILLS